MSPEAEFSLSMCDSPRDLSPVVWALFPPAMLVLLGVLAAASPRTLTWALAKDHHGGGGGMVEHATVLVLIPGIVAGATAYLCYRRHLPDRRLGWWVLAWVAGCTYFAGEEASWGQHFFGWRTPPAIARLNDQGETNLHNISSWLDQKPRSLVELWIFVGGIVVPVWRRVKRTPARSLDQWESWFWPSHACVPAAALMLATWLTKRVGQLSGWYQTCKVGLSEIREYYVATFLCLYLVSLWVRLREVAALDRGKVEDLSSESQ